MTASAGAKPVGDRLLWLSIARVLCALMILGIHWLRASYYVGLFGSGDPVNLVMEYQGQSGGLQLFHYVLIAGTGLSLTTWLTNVIGILGGFGWEAVSALILISGFSLTIAQRGKSLDHQGWLSWYGKRAKRILVPFYLVAVPFLTLFVCAIVVLSHAHGNVATVLNAKLLSHFHTPPLGVIISHLFLFDPYAYQWNADFFAPAWWFIPAILLAYVAYPFIWTGSRFRGGIPLLAGTALLTTASYMLSNAGILVNEGWYYIVLHESFNFTLGVVIAGVWLGEGRSALEDLMSDPRAFAVAFLIFVLGNIANWTTSLRPIASMLYGPSLVLMIVFLAKRLETRRFSPALTSVDSYDLYLVHQPFAFPIALAAKVLLHGYAVFIGWFLFVAVASIAARILARVQRPLLEMSLPALGAVAHVPLWHSNIKRRPS
jgi:hypothetical protein